MRQTRKTLVIALAATLVACGSQSAGRDATGTDADDEQIVTSDADDEQIVTSVEGSCAEEPTPENLRNKGEAFDATVVAIDRGEYNDDAAAAPLRVELQVNEWFKSASDAPPDTIVRDSWDFSPPEPLPEGVVTDLGPGLEPGLRLLSAGSGKGVGDLQVGNCGFTVGWSEDARDEWRGIFRD